MSVNGDAIPYPFERSDGLTMPELYAGLRAEQPIQRVALPYGGDAWLVTRYEDVKFFYSDRRFSRAATVEADIPRISPTYAPPGNILSLDPPEHTRLRKLIGGAFTTKNIERWRVWTQDVVDGLIDEIEAGRHPADLVQRFADPLPIKVICTLFGIPDSDHPFIQEKTHVLSNQESLTWDPIVKAVEDLNGYLSEHIARCRNEKQGDRKRDLLADLVDAHDNTDRLSEAELLQLMIGIIFAGYETVMSQLAKSLYFLLANDLWSTMVEEPDRIVQITEELLRCLTSGDSTLQRVATEDVEIGGQLIRQGETVFGALNSANHDESVFAQAHELDMGREHNPHLAFGFGPHYCIGAQLARMELHTGIGRLATRLPGLRLVVEADQVPWRIGKMVIRPEEIPVRW